MAEHTIRTAFVTGAAGFIGSHVVASLIERGVQVRALVRNGSLQQPAANALAQDNVELIIGDLLAPDGWRDRLRGCDTLFHVAALYSARPADAPHLYEVNVDGAQAVCQVAAAVGVQRVVHTSTIGVIGRPAGGALANEDTPFNLWRGASDYVRSKWLGEAAALLWHRRGLPVVVVCPTAPIGSGDHKPTATGQRIVDFLAGRRPDYPAGGLNLCPVDDIASGPRAGCTDRSARTALHPRACERKPAGGGLPCPAVRCKRAGRAESHRTASWPASLEPDCRPVTSDPRAGHAAKRPERCYLGSDRLLPGMAPLA